MSLVRILPQAPHVAEFLGASPDFDLGASLGFLTQHYANQEWVVEGGVAVHSLTNGNRPEPHDLDIVCLDSTMQTDFNGPNYFDVKSVDLWMACKGLAAPEGFWRHVMDTSISTDIAGASVRLMHPTLIAAGKSFPYAGRPQRTKDALDIELLGISPSELDLAKAKLLGAVAL